MLARTRTIYHPKGVTLETPFLIPSFSSKGKKLKNISETGFESEIRDIIKLMDDADALTQYYLISAYDIYYNALPKFDELPRTEVVFLDSGGYEISDMIEGNTDLPNSYQALKWDADKFHKTLKAWNEWERKDLLPAVLISYDHPDEQLTFDEQIKRALELKKLYPDQLYDILIKPENGNDYTQLITKKLIPNIKLLTAFDILGFTEKELGDSIEKRIENIKKIRSALDANGVDKPIHIFGGLDPTLAVLYYLAGAEIFDGLSWMRFQFHKGVATYHYNFNIDGDIMTAKESFVKSLMMINNLKHLNALEAKMRVLAKSENFKHFEYMQDIYERLSASI